MMQEVLGGLEEFSTMVGYETNTAGFEILSITPPEERACCDGKAPCDKCDRFKHSASVTQLKNFQRY